MAYQSVNPFNGSVLKSFENISDKELEKAIVDADCAFEREWSSVSLASRADVLKRAARIMRDRIDELARAVTLEMGKLLKEAKGEVILSSDILEYYANHGAQFLAPQRLIVE